MTNLSIAFLIIITAAAAAYALFAKKAKIAGGLFIMTLAFILVIPDLATGFWSSILLALSLIIYLLGAIVLVYDRKKPEETKPEEDKNAS